MADVRHSATRRLLLDNFSCGTLRANEHDLVLVLCQTLNKSKRVIKGGNRVLEVDDVNLVS